MGMKQKFSLYEAWEWMRFIVVVFGGIALAVTLNVIAMRKNGVRPVLLLDFVLVWLIAFVSAVTS